MSANKELTKELKELLMENGAVLTGIGNLSELPENVRHGFPIGISVAVKYPKEIIRGIAQYPTPEYKEWYTKLNEQLDHIVTTGAALLEKHGYRALAKTRAEVGSYDDTCLTLLPHKTVATRAGIGWIGKCALLITEQYGSMVRISSILTDAPLVLDEPMNESKCGNCMVCKNSCPAGAIYGQLWTPGIERSQLFDLQKCRETMHERCLKGMGEIDEVCGKCIEVCPYTKRYLKQE